MTTTGGTSATGASDQFTYQVPAPTVTAISPNTGTTAGGTSVTIAGTNFTGATGVTIGGTAATNTIVVSATTITATTPAGAAGTASVVVTTPGGSNAANTLFSYQTTAPAVTAISPNTGTAAGGANVTITGTSLSGASAVTIGGKAATNVIVVSATTITATTPAGAAGNASVVVTTPGGSVTGPGGYTYVIATTSANLVSSVNPAAARTPVTFTAIISTGSGIPTGTVTFKDGPTIIGTATLAGGRAAFTTSSLTVGTHLITAVYAGNATFAASTSAALVQAISVPADSVKLRALQISATTVVAQSSGQAVSNAVAAAITEGFSDSQRPISLSGTGIRFNFTADPPDTDAPGTRSHFDDAFASFAPPGGRDFPAEPGTPQRRIDDALSALTHTGAVTKAPPPPRSEPREWLAWADVQISGIAHWGAASAPSLYGNQVNALLGLTRKLSPNFLIGVLGGYETFDYRSEAVAGRLKGDGWTVGAYLAGKLGPGVRFDAAAAYSGIGYDDTAWTAVGKFNGNRWLLSAGLTGTYMASGFEIEPSGRIYGLVGARECLHGFTRYSAGRTDLHNRPRFWWCETHPSA